MKKVQWIRRELHKHPESGFTEFYTTGFIASYLEELGWDVQLGQAIYEEDRLGVPDQVTLGQTLERARQLGTSEKYLDLMTGGYTGLIATLARGTGKTITLRFDIDCVEVSEANDFAYRSQNPGLMHSCGHDGHTAVGLEVARSLADSHWQGRVNLVFQPAEEGVRGGRVLSKSKLLDGTDYFLSGHLGITDDPVDTLYTNLTESMNTSKWNIKLTGESVHAAMYPESGINALLAASDLVMRLYHIPPPATGQSRLNVGTLRAGSGRNVVAGEAYLKVETRGNSPAINDYMCSELKAICHSIEVDHGVTTELELVGEANFSLPSPALVKLAAQYAEPAGLVLNDAPRPMIGSEDAFYYIDRVKRDGGLGIYVLFGTTIAAPHHNPYFNFNESILDKMIVYYTSFVLDLLK